MLRVVFEFIPLGLAAISPTMVILVTAMLPTERGLLRALAIIAGRFAAHLLLALLFTFLLSQLPEVDEGGRTLSDIVPIVLIGAGIVLLLLAGWVLLHDADPDQPPSRVLDYLNRVGPITLFVANFFIVLVSLRLMSLVFAGSAIIKDADLLDSEEVILDAVLALFMIWPMLIPIGVSIAMGDRRDETLASMNRWLQDHQQAINVGVLSIFGGYLLATGYAGL